MSTALGGSVQHEALMCGDLLAHQQGLDHTVNGEVIDSLARRNL
jgi:hypothetical protein